MKVDEKNSSRLLRNPALGIVIVYIILGLLWILLSDKLLVRVVSDPEILTQLQTFKGWFYVLITGLILYILINRYNKKQESFSKSLVDSQERFQIVAQATHDVVWDWNLETNALWWNENYFTLFGYTKEQTPPDISSWDNFLHREDKDRVVAGIYRVIKSGDVYWSDEYRFKRMNGSYAFIFDRGYVIHDSKNKPIRMVGSMQDITERKQVEDKLLHSRQELRELTAYVESAREEERKRIAREIHDELGQSMTGLKMDISWLSKKIDPSQQIFHQKANEMLQLIDATIHTIRRIATELRPGVLDNLGIQAAIEWQAQEFQHRTHIQTDIHFTPESITLDEHYSIALFRILQEALTNVARHAGATRVDITLRKDTAGIWFEIRDNGRGIADARIANSKSLGLLGIRERVSLLGGTVGFTGKEGVGTTITVHIPITTA